MSKVPVIFFELEKARYFDKETELSIIPAPEGAG
jgi:hypothetical protein